MVDYSRPGGDAAQLFVFEKFGTLNTKANRPMIKDEEFSWIENFMPLGDGNLRTLYAEGAAIYTAPTGRTIVYKYSYNLDSTSYIAAFLDNGTAVQINVATQATTSISATSGLFYDGTTLPDCVQWQATYLVIITVVAGSPNTYFIWDGAVLYQAGTVSPDVDITNGGTGHTSAPTVTAFGGSGSGSAYSATVENGSVTKVIVTNPGSGYLSTDGVVQLAFSGGGSDTSAQATASVSTAGGLGAINITNSGSGYTTSSVISFSGGGGSGAAAVISGLVSGAITQITITNPGTGYISAPTISVTVGSGFTGACDVRYGQVSSIAVTAGGTGYHDNPQVVISAPDSLSLPVLQATAIAVTSGGVVTSITVTQEGLGYTKAPTVTLVGGNNAAAATVTLMPFGIAGTTLETFQNIIWTANGPKVSFTAPGSTSNFATSAGGGSFSSTDNFLRVNYICLKQTNGTLYLIGDSSTNSITNVQTNVANGVSTTVFNNSNIDPQTGTPWRDSVSVFGRAIVFANSSGVYALYGGAAEKVSSPLDTLFANATFNTGAGGGVTPTAAVATVYGIRTYMLLYTTIDPYQRAQRTLLSMWDGQKWWEASQIAGMSYVISQELNSVLSSFMTDGSKIYEMFQTPSTALTKVFQTKLRGDPAPIDFKQVNGIYVLAETTEGDNNTYTLSLDNENGQGAPFNIAVSGTLVFIGSTGAPLTFVGSGPIVWTAAGLAAVQTGTPAYYGRYIGLTATTNAADSTILQLITLYNPYSPVP
jgi:hypothetical protein